MWGPCYKKGNISFIYCLERRYSTTFFTCFFVILLTGIRTRLPVSLHRRTLHSCTLLSMSSHVIALSRAGFCYLRHLGAVLRSLSRQDTSWRLWYLTAWTSLTSLLHEYPIIWCETFSRCFQTSWPVMIMLQMCYVSCTEFHVLRRVKFKLVCLVRKV